MPWLKIQFKEPKRKKDELLEPDLDHNWRKTKECTSAAVSSAQNLKKKLKTGTAKEDKECIVLYGKSAAETISNIRT